MTADLLVVKGLVTGYGKKRVLEGMSLRISEQNIIAVVGRNGSGKSTLLKALYGLLPVWSGEILFDGLRVDGMDPSSLLSYGIAYVPQGHRVFSGLSVLDNLRVGGLAILPASQLEGRIQKALELFPALRPRLYQGAGSLSGGEKQMLALARAAMLAPRLLLLDEPSLGLSPALVTGVLSYIREVSRSLGITVLVVEQRVREVFKIADMVVILKGGHVSFCGSADELVDSNVLRAAFM
jgi:branched-chain amino acid transport system ATP-binding protein